MRTFLLITGALWLGLAVLFALGLVRAARRPIPAPPAPDGEDWLE